MHLILFDIDGTVLDSVQADDACFIQTFQELHGIDLSGTDWSDFTHVTDVGLTAEIFERWTQRAPSAAELSAIKTRFYSLLRARASEFKEVPHARAFIEQLAGDPNCVVGFATGGWRETATLKCEAIGLPVNDSVFKSSDDHFDRRQIVQLAIDEAQERYGALGSSTYFGDGVWDWETAQHLGIHFVGVDVHGNGKLRRAGAKRIVRDYADAQRLLAWITDH